MLDRTPIELLDPLNVQVAAIPPIIDITPIPIAEAQSVFETAWWLLVALLGMLADKLGLAF